MKIPNPSQEPPASFKAPNKDLEDMDALFTFKIKIEEKDMEQGCIKDQQPYPNKIKMPNPIFRKSNILHKPNKDQPGLGKQN